jgi:hypothetical protein
MFCRTILAACSVLWLGFAFAADQADARPLSRGAGASRPAVSAPRSLQRFHQAPAINRTTPGLHVTRHPHRRSFHPHFRHRLPYVFAAPYGYGDYGAVPPTSFAESPPVWPGEPVVINRRPCFVQPHMVLVEGTGEMRAVTVTRCN